MAQEVRRQSSGSDVPSRSALSLPDDSPIYLVQIERLQRPSLAVHDRDGHGQRPRIHLPEFRITANLVEPLQRHDADEIIVLELEHNERSGVGVLLPRDLDLAFQGRLHL
jgi:hypothetical protein